MQFFFFLTSSWKVTHSSVLHFHEGTAAEDHVDSIFVEPLLVNTFIWLFYMKSVLVIEKNMCMFSNYDFCAGEVIKKAG